MFNRKHIHNAKQTSRRALTTLVTLLLIAALQAVGAPVTQQKRDTVKNQRPNTEVREIRSKMATSAKPVEIKQQGRILCVKSEHAQLLPVYRQNGTFYAAFRLNKGNNWLNGLPKGAYIINNKQFSIN